MNEKDKVRGLEYLLFLLNLDLSQEAKKRLSNTMEHIHVVLCTINCLDLALNSAKCAHMHTINFFHCMS